MNQNPTDIEILTGIPFNKPTKPIDLGTSINVTSSNDDVAEMYSNSNYKQKKKRKLNKNTFQQSTGPSDPTNENDGGQAPNFFPSPSASSVRGDTGKTETIGNTEPKYGRRLNWQNDKIVEMHLQLCHIREGTRYSRVKAYISIKTEDDPRYMIFMRSSLTTALDETFRSIRKDCDKILEIEAGEIYNEHRSKDLYMGRVKYKPTKGSKISKHHRKNLPLTMLSVWVENNTIYARLFLLDQNYDFILDEPITESQKPYYSAQGVWSDDNDALSINEAFGD